MSLLSSKHTMDSKGLDTQQQCKQHIACEGLLQFLLIAVCAYMQQDLAKQSVAFCIVVDKL